VTKLQTTPAPTAVTIAAPAALGSLYAIYDQYQFGRKSNGRPHCNEHNVRCAIRLKQFDIYFNDFEQRICLGDREWDEAMTFEFMEFLQHDLEMSDISLKTVRDGITGYAFLHRRNPIQDWLRSLTWDGEMRLPDLLFRGFGTPSDEYSRAVGRCFIVGMVARVMRPGCKADCMPVFEGDQGLRKSTALGIIGGKYFSELHDSIMSKDFYISLQGKMLCEISELHAFKTADIERIKGIISNAVDRFRAPYASISTDHPRQGVFAGTTNRDDWNTDETGARRFWPVLCGEIDIDWLIDNREQLFAEAMMRLNDGEPWWDVPKEQADREREARQDSDPWEDVLAEYLRANNVVRIPYIMDEMLKIKLQDFDMLKQRRIGRILRRHGFKKLVKRDGSSVSRAWERKRP
jgi:putative DNA primase/helicase